MAFFIFLLFVMAIAGALYHKRIQGLIGDRSRAFMEMDAQLRMRSDLLPALQEEIGKHLGEHHETLAGLNSAYAAVLNAQYIEDRFAKENMLGAALQNVFRTADQSPEMKADARYGRIRMEFSDADTRVAKARYAVNEATALYNKTITGFPGAVIAQIMHLMPAATLDESFKLSTSYAAQPRAKAPTPQQPSAPKGGPGGQPPIRL